MALTYLKINVIISSRWISLTLSILTLLKIGGLRVGYIEGYLVELRQNDQTPESVDGRRM